MRSPEGIVLNVVVGIVGIVGSPLGGGVTSPARRAGTINQNDFSLPVGAVILLAIVDPIRRGRPRQRTAD
jgi:uncharacterized membrane protein YeaQ/YmgE (transglycosylase-associated protein family)